jgi:hypothetical protein
MRMELKPTDLGSASSELKHVSLPAVLGSPQNDALLVWNLALQKRVGLSQNELARTPLASLLILEENGGDPVVQGQDAERNNQLVPCVLKNPFASVPGQAFRGNVRRNDGMLLPMQDVALGDLIFKEFDQGWRMGREEERNRTRRFFHDVLSSKILVASFLGHEIYQRLAATRAEETEDMSRLTKLLQEAIDAIVQAAEEY